MQSKDILLLSNRASVSMVWPLLEDLRDSPLTQPSERGGNHAMWIAGHLLVSDHGFQAMMTGAEHARPELKPMFAGGSTPTTNADDYPPFARMLEDLQGSNEAILAWLDGMTEDDLDQPSKLVPPGFEPFFGTWRQVFAMRPLHWAMHRGQLADCRAYLGRSKIMA